MYFLFGICRDLYIVLLVILVVEQLQISSTDLLHDATRKGVIAITCLVVVVKLLQSFTDAGGGMGGRAPRRQKKMEGGKETFFEWASAEMQGWRPNMEDATAVVASLPEPLEGQALFAVFDGHGGGQVSLIASKEFPKVLSHCAANAFSPSTFDGQEPLDHDPDEQVVGSPSDPPRIRKALHRAMLTMDAFLRQGGNGAASKSSSSAEAMGLVETSADKKNAFNLVGSTAIVVLIDAKNGRISVANCGDSRALLCRKGEVVELSEDHKPENPQEEDRIRRAGGHVAQVGPCHRVDGWGLNLSRALGDFHYKGRTDLPPEQQKVIAVPEVRILELTDDDEFLVLACDGIFELNSNQKVISMVRESLEAGRSLEKAVEELVDRSCSPNLKKTWGKGGDNCSAIIVRLKR